jgi:uncharacterized protein with von Willebrand factor type A (vWA) domain
MTIDLAELTAAFSGVLRAAGIPATPERTGRFAHAIALTCPTTTDELYWAARVTLLADHAHIDVFDRVFAQVFRGILDLADSRGDSSQPPPPHTRTGRDRRPGRGDTSGEAASSSTPRASVGDEGSNEQILAAASTDERLRTADFAEWTTDELAALRDLIPELRVAPPPRSRRRHARNRRGERIDLRATIRRSHRTAGDPVERVLRRRTMRPRRVVLIADVSGSMEPYTRAYLHLLHGAVRATKAEAFVFATRLTRLTRDLATTNADVALRRAAAAAPDWSGGTRIGQALATFNDRFGRRGVARGAVVVIVSDGWERDDPAILGEQMARLARLAHRIVWVNPRSAAEQYEPLVGGIAAALPYVDTMVSGHSLAAMDDLLRAIHA